jgi:hypothetical protein
MTFEDFLHESQVGYSTIETKDDLEYVIERTWNAAIEAVVYELGDQAYVDNYAYKSGDPMYAEDVAKKLLTSK